MSEKTEKIVIKLECDRCHGKFRRMQLQVIGDELLCPDCFDEWPEELP